MIGVSVYQEYEYQSTTNSHLDVCPVLDGCDLKIAGRAAQGEEGGGVVEGETADDAAMACGERERE